MSVQKVVIIIPTYNEAAGIEQTLSALFQETKQLVEQLVHVLVFDSASTDHTVQIVSRLQQNNSRLHLQVEAQKTGLGSAYLQAMRYALHQLSADIVVEFDADLSHQPHYIAPMLEKMKTHDVVVGSRYVRGGSIPSDWGWHRKALSLSGNLVARFMLTPKYKDFTSGFRVTDRSTLLNALPTDQFLSKHYAYKLHLFWSLHQLGARITEHPIVFVDRQQGQSKLPANSILDSLMVLCKLRFQMLKRYFKMCLVGASGVILQYIIYNLLRHHMPPLHAVQWAVSAATVNNYLLNSRFTFKRYKVSRAQKIKSFGLFFGYSVLMILLQSHWLDLGIQYIGTGYLKENIMMGTGIVLGSVINYTIYSRFIWKTKQSAH